MNVHSNLSSALKSQSQKGMNQTVISFSLFHSHLKSKMNTYYKYM